MPEITVSIAWTDVEAFYHNLTAAVATQLGIPATALLQPMYQPSIRFFNEYGRNHPLARPGELVSVRVTLDHFPGRAPAEVTNVNLSSPSLTITSETVQAAPSGKSNSRLTVAIGELVLFQANRPAHWMVSGHVRPGQQPMIAERFVTSGSHTVSASDMGQHAQLQITVVTPSLRISSKNEITVPGGMVARGFRNLDNTYIGVAMILTYVLTPLDVSFDHLQFRELPGPVENRDLWGYFQTHRSHPAFRMLYEHYPNDRWTPVNERNEVEQPDIAAITIPGLELPRPFAAGGLRILIPSEYRIEPTAGPPFDSLIFRFDNPMPQTIRIDPDPGVTQSPFRGSFTIWKGGAAAVRRYL